MTGPKILHCSFCIELFVLTFALRPPRLCVRPSFPMYMSSNAISVKVTGSIGTIAGVVAPLLALRAGGGTAARLLLTSSLYAADEAYRLGIYHELIDEARLWARCVQIGEECAAGAPEALQLTKRLLYETIGEQLTTQLTVGAAMSATSRTTDAAQEGLTAFIEKRKPEWK